MYSEKTMVSVLTVTKRDGWQKLAEKSLAAQTYKDFEWIIVYEPNVEVTEFDSIPNYKWVPAPKKTRHSNLSASNNEGLRHCKGKQVLFYQDFIELEPDTIEKMMAIADDKTFITTATINPDGNQDGRYTGLDLPRECMPQEWEENVGMAPMKMLKELGGYDEEYDEGWAWNNVNVADRAAMLDCKFVIHEGVKPRLEFHVKEPDADKTLELNYMRHEMTMRQIQIGKKPLKLNYL